MYKSFFGFSDRPFSLLPDANFLFLSKRHRQVINLLEYGNLNQCGFVVITGEVGSGKTTIIRHFLKHLDESMTVGVITNPSQSFGPMLGWIARSFSLDVTAHDDAALYHRFVDFLLAEYARGKRVVLIIDEAQNLSSQMLEDLRMLSNVNNETDQLIQIVLVGQPELLETLKRPDLRQFVQRIAVHSHLIPLEAQETAAYIRHRLSVVGGVHYLFDDITCAAVHFFSHGMPRLINLICDQALVYAYAEEEKFVTFDAVLEVVRERNGAGLSAFRPIVNDQANDALLIELEPVVNQIRQAAA